MNTTTPFNKIDLLGLTLDQLSVLCATEHFPKYTAKQIADWLYKKRIDSIDDMTNLSLNQRQQLNQIAHIGRIQPIMCQISSDKTKKYLLPINSEPSPSSTQNTQYIETVYIPETDRSTLCVSSQIGCKMGCHFCVTGQQGFHGNLSTGAILNQLFSIPEFDQITNIVFMGMGEPMDNLDAVLDATQILTAPWGLGWSPKRITVSTVGLIPPLRQFLERSQCHLAVSLHNPIPSERLSIMPIQKAYPINQIISLLRQYDWTGQRRLSFEYTMLHNLNDDLLHAQQLVELLHGLPCRVNLIRFHSSPKAPFSPSPLSTINQFKDYLNSHGLICTLRASRGQDIDAACGLLAGKQ